MFFGNCEILARFQFVPVEVLHDTELCSRYLAQRAREYHEYDLGGQEQDYQPEDSRTGGFAARQALKPGIVSGNEVGFLVEVLQGVSQPPNLHLLPTSQRSA